MHYIISFAVGLILLATPISAGKIAWPDPTIPIPDQVQAFIKSECVEYKGFSEETVGYCQSKLA